MSDATPLSNPSTDLPTVEPRDETVRDLRERHLDADHELDPKSSILHHESNTLEVEVSCADCRRSITEVYLLRSVERLSDGHRFSRGENPTCDCDTAAKEGEYFQELRRVKSGTSTAVATGRCAWCGTEFEDVYKYQTRR